jgi:hypothetical protein
MNSLIEKIEISLITEDTDENRKKWAEYIINAKLPLLELAALLDAEKRAATRFSWLIGDICELEPKVVFPAITHFWSKRYEVDITNFNRSLAKMFWLCGIPEEIEGEAVSEMFEWLLDPEAIVSIKNYSLLALGNLTDTYPELKQELRMVIEDQLQKNSVAFEKCAQKVLEKINR